MRQFLVDIEWNEYIDSQTVSALNESEAIIIALMRVGKNLVKQLVYRSYPYTYVGLRVYVMKD